ncbi:MAG: hypothetical protein AMJ53_09010 [Gammaproteobacteria bacterium SG8_11]|nr:MAG: hypothetical protein AMJ53_09010 [Gammaproteobacteria bacterium SG8_11]
MAIVAIFIAGMVGLIARLLKVRPLKAWLIGCTIVPAFVLFVEFVLPYQGGGASMWPIALVFGGAYGAVSSAIGVFIAGLIVKGSENAA